ncbi:MAG: RIP metalloprotease RseP [Legionellales bacterium]|nr:RIP metalloprotease RseP [Legionellales bacterium]
MILTVFYFVLALMVLVIVHEFGHFIVARWCGVKVLRFSFGFGKVLASCSDKRGTEYALSLIPLGGYVKMLDESEGEVLPGERHLAFNRKSISARSAIILAGPVFNFIFAFLALWCVLVMGIKSLAPMIDHIVPGSIAARAGFTPGLEMMSVDGKKVDSWRDFQLALMPLLGTSEPIKMTVKSIKDGHEKTLLLPLANWQLDSKKPDVLESFGIQPFVPTVPPIIAKVLVGSPAAVVGLQNGDTIVSLNGQRIQDWFEVLDKVKHHPNQKILLKVLRHGHFKTFEVPIGSVKHEGELAGYLGVMSQPIRWPAHWLRIQREGPVQALGTALGQTTTLIRATVSFIGRLCMGKLSLHSISGPVGIAEGAGASGRSGLPYYLSFLALVSISLGVLNILPIPLLDGGHLLYCFLEFIWRRPLPESFRAVGGYLGMVVLVALMFIALTNDLTRLI